MDPFAALGDPVRRDLVARLASGPARVVDLAADHAISRPAISRHLRVLAEAGIVEAEDRGRERHYRLERAGLAVLTDWLAALEAPQPAAPVRRVGARRPRPRGAPHRRARPVRRPTAHPDHRTQETA